MNNPFSKTGPNSVAGDAPYPEDSRLHPRANVLLSGLPEGARLSGLAAKFPRIANRIADNWLRPEVLKPYLLNLLTTDRPGREGFPFEVLSELLAFQTYYSTHIFPEQKKTVWDDAS